MVRVKVTDRVKSIEYAIRDVIGYTEKLVQEGRKIYLLNIGDPPAFGFSTPPHIKQALCQATQDGENNYSASEGISELRLAIAAKERRVNNIRIDPNDILITSGVSEGIEMLLGALVEKGDEILFPGPTYPPYISYTKFFDGYPVAYKTTEENRWQPDVDDLRSKITEKTKALVITNPNNPTGALYGKKVVKQMLDVAAEHDLVVISDEIYDQITYSEDFASTANLAKDQPVIGLNGFSKTYSMTGWRLGYMYFKADDNRFEDVRQAILKECRIRLCANTPVQKAGVAALEGPQDHIKVMVDKLRERRDFTLKRINEIEGISLTKPEGAFYAFPKIHDVGQVWKTDLEFVIDLLKETGVLMVHGSGFDNQYGSGHARLVFLPEVEILTEAFNQLEYFMKKRIKK